MFDFVPVKGIPYRYEYDKIADDLNRLEAEHTPEASLEAKNILYAMGKLDMFFLGYFILGLKALNNPFLYDRVREVQLTHDRTLDLWAREHWKSTIISYLLNIWLIINDPEVRIGIFSFNRNLAKAHLRRIKTTIENNKLLQAVYDDTFFADPEREAEKWSEDEGICVRRKGQWLEMTVEAWGVTEAMPIGRHYSHMDYDDLVVPDSVGTQDQIQKTIDGFRMSTGLGARGGTRLVVGTIYHFADLHNQMRDDGNWKSRIYPAEVDENGRGKRGGRPIFLSREELDHKYTEYGAWGYASQMLMNPVAEEQKEFRVEWLKRFINVGSLNYYILGDPAGTKKKRSDYTVLVVIGVDSSQRMFLVDMVRDKLKLAEKWVKLRGLWLKWRPLEVGYEEYGLQADREYFDEKMQQEGIYFNITPLGGKLEKNARIKRMQPLFESGRFLIPYELPYVRDGRSVALISEFIVDEYTKFPFPQHDDILDAISRIRDLDVVYPAGSRNHSVQPRAKFDPLAEDKPTRKKSWMLY